MIRILHTADWHLGHTFVNYDRTQEHKHFLSWLSETIQKQEVDVLLIAGDIFDVSNPSASSQRNFYQFIHDITNASPKLQIIITAGNHDSASRLETPIPLLSDKRTTVVGLLPNKNGEVAYEDLVIPLYNKFNEIEAYCLAVPFLRQGDYPRVEAENPYAAGISLFYENLINEANKIKTKAQGLVAMGHMQTIGSEFATNADRSEKFIIGGLEAIPTTLFTDLNYTALGHIHKAQRISGSDHIRYSGSPLPMSFAEKNYNHGVVLVSLEGSRTLSIEKITYEPLVKMISVPKSGYANPELVLQELDDLPERVEGDDFNTYPYLEVKVRLEEPEPLLANRISEILATKAVRFARAQNDYGTFRDTVSGEFDVMDGLTTLSPLDILQREFSKKYDADMSQDLINLFTEISTNLDHE